MNQWLLVIRDSVLECASPVALLAGHAAIESATGLAHSKTWRIIVGSWKGTDVPCPDYCEPPHASATRFKG